MDILSFFANPSLAGIGLAILFGAVWLLILHPLGWRRPGLWLLFIAGALLFPVAIAWVQVPLQNWVSERMLDWLGLAGYSSNLLWAAIPVILLSGLVQEAFKLLPVVIYWLLRRRSLEPKDGLSAGALAGAGCGIFEAQWVLNSLFASGWSWGFVEVYGFTGLAGFYERFFTIGFHTASTALAGLGLARGWGWQFYLLASFLHFLTNYTIVLMQKGLITSNQLEMFIAVFSVLLFALIVWLRRRKNLFPQSQFFNNSQD